MKRRGVAYLCTFVSSVLIVMSVGAVVDREVDPAILNTITAQTSAIQLAEADRHLIQRNTLRVCYSVIAFLIKEA